MSLAKLFTNLSISKQLLQSPAFLGGVNLQATRTFKFVTKPKPGKGQQFKRLVHFPEDGKYTVKPLDNTHMAGRDPITGRKVAIGISGGVKHK
jgi:large subunit ribosomal protein L2